MHSRSELFARWQEADLLATEAERLLAADFDAFAKGLGPRPTPIRMEVVDALRVTAHDRLRAALDAYEKSGP